MERVGVLSGVPDHVLELPLRQVGREAAELLETLIAGPPEEDSSVEAKDISEPRVEALQRWLDAVRLASERLKT